MKTIIKNQKILELSVEVKLRLEGDERVNRPLAYDKGKLSNKRSVERLIPLLGTFHRKNEQCLPYGMKRPGVSAIDKMLKIQQEILNLENQRVTPRASTGSSGRNVY